MPECYVAKGGELECDKPLHRVVGSQNDIFSVTYFLSDPF